MEYNNFSQLPGNSHPKEMPGKTNMVVVSRQAAIIRTMLIKRRGCISQTTNRNSTNS